MSGLTAPQSATERSELLQALQLAGRRSVLSHEVAAQLLGIELLEPAVRRLTVPRNRSRLSVPGWAVVRADVPLADQHARDGLRVTSVARTVADLARVLPPSEALVAADSALRVGLAPASELLRLSTAQGSGAARVRLVGRNLDPLSGSVLESLLRWTFVTAGLPAPLTQYRVCDEYGVEVARVDFCWPSARLVVEADGFAFHSDRAAYQRDRQRGNDLTRLGWRVLRFTWEDVRGRPERVTRIVRACLGAAGPF